MLKLGDALLDDDLVKQCESLRVRRKVEAKAEMTRVQKEMTEACLQNVPNGQFMCPRCGDWEDGYYESYMEGRTTYYDFYGDHVDSDSWDVDNPGTAYYCRSCDCTVNIDNSGNVEIIAEFKEMMHKLYPEKARERWKP